MAKILIVEDTQDQLELYAKTFRRAGFEVFGAHDGGHAMERVRDIRPDIILLDQMMPEVDGITFLQNLRRFPKWKNLPVIIVTGLNDRLLKTRAHGLGVSDFLQKGSFHLRDLIELVRERVGLNQPKPQTAQTAPAAQQQPEQPAPPTVKPTFA